MESTTVQQKIKFLLCQTALNEDKFILQAENPQYMFQVLYFKDHAQFEQFKLASKSGPYVKVLGYRIALRLSASLQPINITQQNVDQIYKETQTVIHDACTWFFETFIRKSESNNAIYREEEV